MNMEAVAAILGAYFALTTIATCFEYRRAVGDDRDEPLRLLGFLFLGGIFLPLHRARRRGPIAPRPVTVIDVAVGAFLLILILGGCAFFGVSVAAAFDRRYAAMLGTLGIVHRITTWTAWLLAAVILISRAKEWRPLRIAGWAIASLVAGFLFIPVLYATWFTRASTTVAASPPAPPAGTR